VLITTKGLETNAKFNARAAGLEELKQVVLPMAAVPLKTEVEELNQLGKQTADAVIETFCRESVPSAGPKEVDEETTERVLQFSGDSYSTALDNMEKYFLQHHWSDGFPLVPPTQEAVNRMLEGTELPRDHVVGLVEPEGAAATIESIAINAVMAGCLPQYMPVLIAAVECVTDPRFDLRGIQGTSCSVSPLLVISGGELIEQLNINDGFSAIGPGWKANATIGRAVQLIMSNIGNVWPGRNDMTTLGSPLKYVMLLAENESAYGGVWEPIRVAEGFDYAQPTISAMPAISWQPDHIPSVIATVDKTLELISLQGKVKYDRFAANFGLDNMVLLTPTAFEPIRLERRSREDIQKALYEAIQLPCSEFFEDKEPSTEAGVQIQIPERIVEKCKANPQAFAPLLFGPESLKIIVTGGPGPAMLAYISTWGWGRAYFVMKPISLPKYWKGLLEKY
tara:strand:- start:62 stop:1417 length:1356 start_codon:yes stop_codon:yes gene_type:complete